MTYISKNNLINAVLFLFGLSFCVSTALMTVLYVLMVILAFLTPDFINKFKNVFSNRFVLLSVIFYLAFVVATSWSKAPWHNIWKMLVHIIIYLLAPFIFLVLKENKPHILIKGFLIGAMLSAILSIIAVILHHRILYGVHDYPGTIFHGHILHNAFLAIAATIFLVIALEKASSKQLKVIAGFCYLICFLDIFFIVDGRTGMIMMLTMNIFSILNYVNKKGLLLLILAFVLVIPALYFSPIVHSGIKNYQSDMENYKHGYAKTSMGARIVFHQVSNALIKERPFFGFGTGSFAKNYNDYIVEHKIDVTTVNPHRDILLIGVETGALGVIIFILMLGASYYESAKLELPYRIMGQSLIWGYVAASIENSFFMDNVTGVTFVVLMLALLATSNLANKLNIK